MLFCRIFANRLQKLVCSFTSCRCQEPPTHTNFLKLLPHHLDLCAHLMRALHEIPSMRHTAEEIGLSYQDIEWFSRATMLRSVMLVHHLFCEWVNSVQDWTGLRSVDLTVLQAAKTSAETCTVWDNKQILHNRVLSVIVVQSSLHRLLHGSGAENVYTRLQ